MDEIEQYEQHEAWLTRQHALLADLEDMTDLPHDPPPRALDPLPWWKDEHRVNGEAQRIIEALRFVWEVIKAVVKRVTRSVMLSPFFLVPVVTVVLFLIGFAAARV